MSTKKKRMMKRTLSILLSVLMILTMLPMSALAAKVNTNGIGTYTIRFDPGSPAGDVTFPEGFPRQTVITNTDKTDSYTIPTETPSRPGYQFKCWRDSSAVADGAGSDLNPGDVLNLDDNCYSAAGLFTLKAEWEETTPPTETFTVTLLPGSDYIALTADNKTTAVVEKDGSCEFSVIPTNENYIVKTVYANKTKLTSTDDAGKNYRIENIIEDQIVTISVGEAEKTAKITVPASNPAGVESTTGLVAEEDYPVGKEYSFRVKLAEGYDISTLGVYANGIALSPAATSTSGEWQYSFVVKDATEITFGDPSLNVYTVTLPTGSNYTALTEDNKTVTTVSEGEDCTFTVTPSSRYTITAVYANGEKLDAADDTADAKTYTIKEIKENQNVSIVVDEKIETAEITVPGALPEGITASGLVNKADVVVGTTYTFKLTLADGYDISKQFVYANGVALNPVKVNEANTWQYSFVVAGNTEITVGDASLLQYTVTLPTGGNFNALTEAHESVATVDYKGSCAFTVTPIGRYKVDHVYANGVELAGTDGSYKITDITANQVVTIEMAEVVFHTVIYVLDGAMMLSQQVQDDTAFPDIAAPAKTGYEFSGWFSDANYTEGNELTTANKVNDNLIAFGRYEPKTVKITFDANGGEFETGGTTTAQEKTYGKATVLTSLVPVRVGYSFLGWSEDENAEQASFAPGATYSNELEEDITLYAVWKINTLNITLPTGTGYTVQPKEGFDTTVDYGDDFTFIVTVDPEFDVETPVVTANGVTLEADSQSGRAYTYTIETITENQVVSIQVTRNEIHTVTFDVLGETYQTQRVEHRALATQPVAPTVEGYTFEGWFTDKNCNKDDRFEFTTEITGDTTVYAKMEEITLQVKLPDELQLDRDGVTITRDVDLDLNAVPYGETVTFTVEVAEGFDPSGIMVAANGLALTPTEIALTTPDIQNSYVSYVYTYVLSNITADQTVTLVGVVRRMITVTYNDNGGLGGPMQEQLPYYVASRDDNGNLTLVTPTRVGFTFVEWNTAADGKGTKYKPGALCDMQTDTILYAIWKRAESELQLTVSPEEQYENENVILTATLKNAANGAITSGSIQFYRVNTEGKTLIATVPVSGGSAMTTATVCRYPLIAHAAAPYHDADHFKAVYVPNETDGYSAAASNVVDIEVKSEMISWACEEADNIRMAADADKLTIRQQDGTPADEMIAGNSYTLELPKVKGLTDADLTVGVNYRVVWQYFDTVANDWTDYTNASSADTAVISPEFSGFVFRALVFPVYNTAADSYFRTAAAYTDGTVASAGAYLVTQPTAKTTLRETETTLKIRGAVEEAADVRINGGTPFTEAHLAQYEGENVILEAEAIDTESDVGVPGGFFNFYKHEGDGWVLLNTSPIPVGINGKAELEITADAYDANFGAAASENLREFYAEYLENDTYATSSSKDAPETLYLMSTKIQTPVIDAENGESTGYNDDLMGLGAGISHTFTLRTGAAKADWSVVALDGRTVAEDQYSIVWLKQTGDNEESDAAAGAVFVSTDNKVGDTIRVQLKPLGHMTVGAFSKKAVIGEKQPVTVTVTTSDEIALTAEKDVYQLNPITLTAEVKANDEDATMQPTGTVTFYYQLDGAGAYTKIGEAQNLAKNADTGEMTAALITSELPVQAEANTKQHLIITAVYSGDNTFLNSGKFNAESNIVPVAACTTETAEVDVYSSVIYVSDAVENKVSAAASGFDPVNGICIRAEDNAVLANEERVNLEISKVYTLDQAAEVALMQFGVDYTVQWQKLSNANLYAADYAAALGWENIVGATGEKCQIDVEQGAAYRAVITAKDTPIAKGSYTQVEQAVPGRQVYYSNILTAKNGQTTLTMHLNTSNTAVGYEGAVEGETVTVNTYAAGMTGLTPISELTLKVRHDGEADPVFEAVKYNVNGHVAFDWLTEAPGRYTIEATANPTNGYDPVTVTKPIIVRDDDYGFDVQENTFVYDGKVQGLEFSVSDMCDEFDPMAQQEAVVYYYNAEGEQVEPTQAGTYKAVIRLQESAYWTEKTEETTLVIEQRPVQIVDLIAAAKTYDGKIAADTLAIILNDAAVDSTTGLPTEETGIINGDSIYAVGLLRTASAEAGVTTLCAKNVELAGDDAANYVLDDTSYTEEFVINRSQVKGAIAEATYAYTGKTQTVPADDIYLIDQTGRELRDNEYTVTYYYHNGDGVEKVTGLKDLGMYTVIARPDQDNYKGGASQTVYVAETAIDAEPDRSAVSALMHFTDTAQLYGSSTGVKVEATSGTVVKVEYFDGGWSETVPTDAGRYMVRAISSTGDTAYGLYTITKAYPTITVNAKNAVYNSAPYSGDIEVTGDFTLGEEAYISYTGGTIVGVAYQEPTEVGTYVVTFHSPETNNFVAHEASATFEITPKELTLTADDLQRCQYTAFPDMTVTATGLAAEGKAPDTSLRDVQIAPEILFNYDNHAMDQVGNQYPMTPVSALARNYEITYVAGNLSVTSTDAKPYFAIHGMIDNGDGDKTIAYADDVFQLYAYGNQNEQGIYNTSSVLKWSVTGNATITEDGWLTITDPGEITVTLTRGVGRQQIKTSITFTALKHEVRVEVPDQDLVYNGAEQRYSEEAYGYDEAYAHVGDTPELGNDKRTNIGSQIVTGAIPASDTHYQSEVYGGLFTINDKDVVVAPKTATTTYGTVVSGLAYTEDGVVGGVPALTDAVCVSIADVYANLDVANVYEILVAGAENMNYNVSYTTRSTANAVQVNDLRLTVNTVTVDDSIGKTSGSLNPAGKYPVNGAEVADPASSADNVRMYGEPNRVMNDELVTLIQGDSAADLAALQNWLVKFAFEKLHDIAEDANIGYDTRTLMAGKSDYTIGQKIDLVNYDEVENLGTQNIYQRPFTLSSRTGEDTMDIYFRTSRAEMLDIIEENLLVEKYRGEGGLAELLNHTIEDLDLQYKIEYQAEGSTAWTVVADDFATLNPGKYRVTVTAGNPNYWLAEPYVIMINVSRGMFRVVYNSFTSTKSTVTLYEVDEEGNETPAYLPDDTVLNCIIYNYKADGSYLTETPVLTKPMTRTSKTGQYTVSYSRLIGKYQMFAIAEGYTILNGIK